MNTKLENLAIMLMGCVMFLFGFLCWALAAMMCLACVKMIQAIATVDITHAPF